MDETKFVPIAPDKQPNWITLRDFLIQTKDYESFAFDMGVWVDVYDPDDWVDFYGKYEDLNPECGTAACLGGSVQIIREGMEIKPELFTSEGNHDLNISSVYDDVIAAATWLGINSKAYLNEQGEEIIDAHSTLFNGSCVDGEMCLSDITLDMALLVIDKVIDTGMLSGNCWLEAFEEITGKPYLNEDGFIIPYPEMEPTEIGEDEDALF